MTSAVHYSSTSNNWHTPDHIITATLQVFGTIDLDPCSPFLYGPVPAGIHYTVNEDGLSKDWYGKVYMNPPYGREIESWVRKVIQEHSDGRVSEAILLLPARTDTKWFNLLGGYLWCAIRGRLKFSGHNNSAPFPSAVFYLGEHGAEFINAFHKLGHIWELSTIAYSWPNVPIREVMV